MKMDRAIGLSLTGTAVLFLAMDAVLKVLGAPVAISATAELGFPPETTRVLGFVLALTSILYAVPKTSVLGAVLLTGYLGGAVAVQLQHGSPLATHVFFGFYIGVIAWAGVWLRTREIRSLIPIYERLDP
jgi:hypothetical protein